MSKKERFLREQYVITEASWKSQASLAPRRPCANPVRGKWITQLWLAAGQVCGAVRLPTKPCWCSFGGKTAVGIFDHLNWKGVYWTLCSLGFGGGCAGNTRDNQTWQMLCIISSLPFITRSGRFKMFVLVKQTTKSNNKSIKCMFWWQTSLGFRCSPTEVKGQGAG